MTPEKPLAMIHVDLDGLSEIAQSHGWPWRGEEDPIFGTGMRAMLDVFEARGIRATLFVVARDLADQLKRPLIDEALERGHEIASHSQTHFDLLSLDRSAKRRELADSKRNLESELGVEIRGFRAPGYRIDLEALELLAEEGYDWDASAFPTAVFADRLGTTVEDLTAPLRPVGPADVLELPLPDHRPFPIPFSPSYAHLAGIWFFKWGIERAARRGRSFPLLFHLIDFARPLPAGGRLGLEARIWTLSTVSQARKVRRCHEMLDEVEKRYTIVPTAAFVETIPGGPASPRETVDSP